MWQVNACGGAFILFFITYDTTLDSDYIGNVEFILTQPGGPSV
jgi:hypothetical protein